MRSIREEETRKPEIGYKTEEVLQDDIFMSSEPLEGPAWVILVLDDTIP